MIDRNFYPTDQAKHSNKRWRPIGMGIMGLQMLSSSWTWNLIVLKRWNFPTVSRVVYYAALTTSCELAEAKVLI
ncbi:MAG: hypothetical protein R3A45_03085 [Bdellovibrionota bacterium]